MTDDVDRVAVVGGHRESTPVPGSILGWCGRCPNRVWLSKASVELVVAGAEVICWTCYRAAEDTTYLGWSHEGVAKLRQGVWPFEGRGQ